MRIEIASSSDSERGGRGGRGGREMGYDMSRADHPDGPDRTLGDWRSGPRAQEATESPRPGGAPGGGFSKGMVFYALAIVNSKLMYRYM